MTTKLVRPSVWMPPDPPAVPESRVDRALRLQAEYVVARDAARDATASLDEGEFREFRERVGR